MNQAEKEEQIREEMTYAAREIAKTLRACQARFADVATGKPTPAKGIAFEAIAHAMKDLSDAIDLAEKAQ